MLPYFDVDEGVLKLKAHEYLDNEELKIKPYKYDGYINQGASSVEDGEDKAFVVNSSGVMTSYKDRFISILLPGIVNGKVVTGIAEGVFKRNNYLKRLIIPATADFTEQQKNEGAEA